MEKMKMESVDLILKNVEKIAELFPECVTEAADKDGTLRRLVDFDKLRQVLSGDVAEEPERYDFTWVGKRAALAEAHTPIRKTLRPCPEESRDWDTTQNLYIEGDNLDVLKLLQESYLGKVKMIYIDPPYNTGNDFVYADDFHISSEDWSVETGAVEDGGTRLFRNTDSNGRFHSDWCSMIYPRLLLARNLLTDNGLIMVSIDDNEIENLKKICNEVFGKQNFVDTIIWKKRYGGGAKEKYLVTLQEYILVYCKNLESLDEIFVPLSKESAERYYNKKDDKYATRGGYRTHPLEAGKAMDSRPNLVFPIPSPEGTMIMPRRQWLWSKDRVYEALNNGDLEFTKGKDGNWVVSTKQYLRDNDGSIRPGKMFSVVEDIYTQHGTNEMIEVFGNAKVFSYPKPSELIKKLVTICAYEKDMIVLDFFSGSSSTAHAVIKQNQEDGNYRRFIMVQLPEKTKEDSDALKAGYYSITEIGKERIRRAGDKLKAENPLTTKDLDIGFRVLKVDSTNMNDVYYGASEVSQDLIKSAESNVKDDRTDLDLLFGCLLDWGLPLSLPYKSEEIDDLTIHDYNDGDLIACFAENVPQKAFEKVVETIAKRKPIRAVFRDSCFETDAAKINVTEIFKRYSPDTRIKTI